MKGGLDVELRGTPVGFADGHKQVTLLLGGKPLAMAAYMAMDTNPKHSQVFAMREQGDRIHPAVSLCGRRLDPEHAGRDRV